MRDERTDLMIRHYMKYQEWLDYRTPENYGTMVAYENQMEQYVLTNNDPDDVLLDYLTMSIHDRYDYIYEVTAIE